MAEEPDNNINRIAIGSCANQDRNQIIWEPIIEDKPELFIFLGDNVYADTEDMSVMRAKYQKFVDQPRYQKLKSICPVLATWDDHDYGKNDAGKEYPKKVEAESIFHEFFETPKDSEALTRPGIYQARYFGEPGKRLQVILLDTRYFRDPLVELPKRIRSGVYSPNPDPKATILGEAQWKWLEKTLQEPADFRIIASSIQVIPEQHNWELWGNFPHQRTKLLNLLKTHVSNPVLFISGDRHMGEISKLATTDSASPGYPVYELTSSGLTNAGGGQKNEPNRHRISTRNFQSRNYGVIDINWDSQKVQLQLCDVEGKTVETAEMSFAK